MRLETPKIGGCKGNKNPLKLTKKERDFLGGKWAKHNLFIANPTLNITFLSPKHPLNITFLSPKHPLNITFLTTNNYFLRYFFKKIVILCYNNNVGGVHGSASFVSNLEQLA